MCATCRGSAQENSTLRDGREGGGGERSFRIVWEAESFDRFGSDICRAKTA